MLSNTMRSRALVNRLFRQIPSAIKATQESNACLYAQSQPHTQVPSPSFPQKRNFSPFNTPSDSFLNNRVLSLYIRSLHQNTTQEEGKEEREILSDESAPSQGIDAYDRAVSPASKESEEGEEIEETHTSVKIVSSTLIPDNVPQDDPTDESEYVSSGEGVVGERRERSVREGEESERAGRRRPWERRRREKVDPLLPSRENVIAALAELVSTKKYSEDPVSLLEHLCNRFPRELVVNFNILALRPKYVVDATLEILSPSEPKITMEAGRGESHSKKMAKHFATVALVEKLLPSKEEGDTLKVEEEDDDDDDDDSVEEEEGEGEGKREWDASTDRV